MKNDTTTIHRFHFKPATLSALPMPENAVILDLSISSRGLCISAMVDTSEPKQKRYFGVFQTGQPCPYGFDIVHLRTISSPGIPAVHVFEIPKHIAAKMEMDHKSGK